MSCEGWQADVTFMFPLLAAAPPGKRLGFVIPRHQAAAKHKPSCQTKKNVEFDLDIAFENNAV